MKFLNKKEQVIDLEITPYGKSLLSMGRFLPEYYAFFDEDVLYDSQYVGFSEPQNSASVRIREASQLETQAYFYSAERQVKEATAFHRLTDDEKERAIAYGQRPMDINQISYVQDDAVTIGTIPDREFDKAPIGNSSLNTSYAPAWNINVIEGEIKTVSKTSIPDNLSIPQLNMTASMFKFTLTDDPVGDNYYEFSASLLPEDPLRGVFLNVIEDSIILEVGEDNTLYEWENFDIEVFEVESVDFKGAQPIGEPICVPSDPPLPDECPPTVTKEFLTPLFFKKTVSQVQNGILIDIDKIPIDLSPVTSEYAEYYFDINIDEQIDEGLLCEKATNKADGLFSQRTLSCEEKEKQTEINIERLYEPDSAPDCDEDEE